MVHLETNQDATDLTEDFIWAIDHKWDHETFKSKLLQLADIFPSRIDWDEGIEKWGGVIGKSEGELILLNYQIPFAFISNCLKKKFQHIKDIRIYFYNDYEKD